MKDQTVLVVDDDENMVQLISLYLQREGYSVLRARDGTEAINLHAEHRPDLVVLDIMLPEMDGWEVCKALRQTGETPVIMLTARRDDYDKVLGLELGADDYVTKPFNPRELMARIRAVLRRAPVNHSPQTEKTHVQFAGLQVDRETWSCRVDGREVPLTAKEFDLLWLLVKNPRRVFTREKILEHIWGFDYVGDTRTVDTHIKKLRKKLENGAERDWRIATVWGVGYRFEVDR